MAKKDQDIEIIIEIDADVKGMQKDLERLVRDTYSSRSAEVQKEIIREELEDEELDQFQWVAELDGDTCPDCEDMDGEIFESVDDADAPPMHPNCRCVLSPVIDQESLLDIIKNLIGLGD